MSLGRILWVGLLLVFDLVRTTSGAATSVPILPVEQIRPGMKGYGLTVFRGTEIERFRIRVVSVMRNVDPKADRILIEMWGGPLEDTGIIAGMSGSPVFIGGKLIGAVAYGWRNSKSPLAGVTPISDMLDVLDTEPTPKTQKASLESNGWFDSLTFPLHSTQWLATAGWPDTDVSDATLVPIATPLMVSGLSETAIKRLAKILRPYGMMPVQSGGSAKAMGKLPPLSPGSAIGVQLVSGDVDMSAVGTVTYRDGDKVLAFGHPMMGMGPLKMPITVAYVHSVIPSRVWSFKLAGSLGIVGTLTADRHAAIGGIVGPAPRMIPCSLTVEGRRTRHYKFRVAEHKRLTANLIDAAFGDALIMTERTRGDAMVDVRMKLEVEGREKPIVLENRFFESSGPSISITRMISPIFQLMNNPFQPIHIRKAELYAVVRERRETADIASVNVNSRVVRPGDTLNVQVQLKLYKGPFVTKSVSLKIPPDVVPGKTLTIIACDSSTSRALDRSSGPGKYAPENLDQLIGLIQEVESNTNLVVRVALPKLGVTLRGEALPQLPGSVLSVLAFSNTSGIGPLRDSIVKRIPTKWVLSGAQSVQVTVIKENDR